MMFGQLLTAAGLLLVARWLWRTGRAEKAERREATPGYVHVPGTCRRISCEWMPEDETEYRGAVSKYRGEN